MQNFQRKITQLMLLLLVGSGTSVALSSQVSAIEMDEKPVSSLNFSETTAEKLNHLNQSRTLIAKGKPKPFVQAGPPEFVQYVPPRDSFVQAGPPEFVQYVPPTTKLNWQGKQLRPSAQEMFASLTSETNLS